MVKSDRFFFVIPTPLSCKQGNNQEMVLENSKYKCYFEYSRSGCPRSWNKRVGISKKNSVILYPIFIYILKLPILFEWIPVLKIAIFIWK